MRQPSVGCVGVELFKELKRQRDVDVRICTWRRPCRGWLEHLFSGWWASPLTCSHHYRHHRSRLIKALPPWLTLRLSAHEGEERGEQTWTVFAEDCRKGGLSSGQKVRDTNLTGNGAGMQQRRTVAKPYSLYALFITLNPGWQGCVMKNAL